MNDYDDDDDDRMDEISARFREFVEAEITSQSFVKHTLLWGDGVIEAPFQAGSIIDCVREAVKENLPGFGLDGDKRELYLFENDTISMSFRPVAERFDVNGKRVLFVIARDFGETNPLRAVYGFVWE